MSEHQSEEQAIAGRKPRVSAFRSAKIDFSVRAEIGVRDVQGLCPGWSEEQCMEFLRSCGDTIGREMAMAGAIALAVILKGDSRGN